MPRRLDPQKRKTLLTTLASLSVIQPLSSPLSLVQKHDTLRSSSSAQIDPIIAAAAAYAGASLCDTDAAYTPHPEQGGQAISEEYLCSLSEAECVWRFRFTASELCTLVAVLDLPDPLITERGYHAAGIECIGLLCARLRSPEDQWSLSTKYARPQSAISEITNETADYINSKWSHLLRWDRERLVHPERLREYAQALNDFGSPSGSIFGFIDCTIRPTCRPGVWQELAYTGYKKLHGMKFQGIVLPNGLITHLDGPYLARQNDLGVLAISEIIHLLMEHAIQPGSQEGDPPQHRYFQLYGDSAYGVSQVMVSPYCGSRDLTPEETAFNKAMGQLRISVEHGFGLVLQDWPFLNAFWKHKIFGNACGLLYRVGVLLTNAHACMVPNQTAVRYKCDPPSVAEYFHE